VSNPFAIDVTRLALYPVLSKGAPANPGSQTTLGAEGGHSGAVDGHPNSVESGTLVTF
jgi:hypothetical protein